MSSSVVSTPVVDAGAPLPTSLALLPAPLLQAAALFASDDAAKQALCRVNIRHDSGRIRIAATNGHYACRFWVPTEDPTTCPAWVADASPVFNLDAKSLAKRSAYARWAEVRSDGEVRFLGGRKIACEFLESRNCGDPLPRYATEWPPGFDALWPDSYSCKPGGLIGWNAAYMARISDVIAKLTDGNQVAKFESNGPTTPLRISCDLADPWDKCSAEFLLMPVQIRAK